MKIRTPLTRALGITAAALALLLGASATGSGGAPTPKPTPKPTVKAEKPQPDAKVLANAKKVQRAYEKLTDLSAKFEQTVTIKVAGNRQGPLSTGTIAMKKPGKMRWFFDEGLTFVSDGSTLWQYDPEESQVIVNKHLQQTASMTALNFLAGMGTLTTAFDVSEAEARGEPADRGIFLKLSPKDEDDVQLQGLILVVDNKTWLAKEAYLIDMVGNETHLVFKEMKVNQGLKDSTFVFQIPEGAEVIEPALLMGGGGDTP